MEKRLLFYSEGRVVQNKEWGGFVYAPASKMQAQAYYIVDPDAPFPDKEYEYSVATNASGLIQQTDVDPARPAVLFLGDSFTEGEGASPWFYKLERAWPQEAAEQIIDGGVMGTGVEAWGRLYDDTSSQVKITKAVVIFISDDWRRPVWQFRDQDLACLKDSRACDPGRQSVFGLPSDPVEARRRIAAIAQGRIEHLFSPTNLKGLIRASAIYQQLLQPAYHAVVDQERPQFEKSAETIAALVAKLGRDNVLLVQLPQREELEGGPEALGKRAVEFITRNGFQFVNGFEACGLDPSDYHIEGHPNANGYGKIAKCVDRAVKEAFHLS
ncbi:SGNH/GDSL hydrolase family protein [Methylocapsa acidiphila]|uniref:SGNH/GDSL hydrolase family protein n=1 Tax=Methylocapsa acidiphila TaxID=133552 RepID=UPI000420FEAC|nr:SGNH/GDSL hydrolase family protein [Methylocapsa acidiphila]